MRPEYVLTEPGARLGACCDQLLAALDSVEARALALSKWSMPAVFALRSGTLRFCQVRDGCPGVTDRALTQTLKALAAGGLVVREVAASYPPSVAYSLTATATGIADHLCRLAETIRTVADRRNWHLTAWKS
ncbi:MAG: winged helix-turn-helix transcriptional regulator [Armatimonadetes bacterium]|nr:winged helix-turn-helix transcriptional regulator [Armatimonadota bacterium]